MEDAFTKLKQITAVSSLEEMHEKFLNQRNNKRILEHDVKEAESRLLAVKNINIKNEIEFLDLKNNGNGRIELTRESITK